MSARRCFGLFLSIFMVLSLSGAKGLEAAQKDMVAVFPIQGKRIQIKKDLLDVLGDHLTGQLVGSGQFAVVPRDQLKKRLMNQKKESYKSCMAQSCQIELGRELAAEKALAAQILRIGRSCKVQLVLYDLKEAAAEKAASHSGNCHETGLLDSLNKAVAGLVKVEKSAPLNQPGPHSCTLPDWVMDPPGDQTMVAVGGGTKWALPQVQLMEALVQARTELGRQLQTKTNSIQRKYSDKQVLTSEEASKSIAELTLMNSQMLKMWQSCDGSETYALVGFHPATKTKHGIKNLAQLTQRIDKALPTNSSQWVNQLPKIPGVILGMGMGGNAIEAESMAWNDLSLAMYDKMDSHINDYNTHGAGQEERTVTEFTKHLGMGPNGCSNLPHQKVRYFKNEQGWHFALVASVKADEAKLLRCKKHNKTQSKIKAKSIANLMTRAKSTHMLRPVQAKSQLVKALKLFRELGNMIKINQHNNYSKKGEVVKVEKLFTLISQPGIFYYELMPETVADRVKSSSLPQDLVSLGLANYRWFLIGPKRNGPRIYALEAVQLLRKLSEKQK